jgi:hypothetical protein
VPTSISVLMAAQKAPVSSSLTTRMTHAMRSSNSTDTIGRAAISRFVKTALLGLDHHVVVALVEASAAVEALEVAVEAMEVDLAEVVEASAVDSEEVVEDMVEVAMVEELLQLLEDMRALLRILSHRTRSLTSPPVEESVAHPSMFAT